MSDDTVLQEAAQFCLFSRLAPSLRHRLLGKLQPMGLTAALVAMQLRGDKLNLAGAREAIAKAQLQVREATESVRASIAWLTDEDDAVISFSEGVHECVDLVRTDSEMRGVTIISPVDAITATISRRALRLVLTAALIALVDMKPAQSRVELRQLNLGTQIELSFDLTVAPAVDRLWPPPQSRLLTWNDVEALAQLVGVVMSRLDDPFTLKCCFDVIVDAGKSHPTHKS